MKRRISYILLVSSVDLLGYTMLLLINVKVKTTWKIEVVSTSKTAAYHRLTGTQTLLMIQIRCNQGLINKSEVIRKRAGGFYTDLKPVSL